LLGVLLVCAPPLAPAIFAEPFVFEDAEVSTVVKHVSRLTGITFLFDPAQVKGKITVLAPGSVSATEALELLTAALAVHGYRLVAGTAAMWVVPVERLAPEAVVVEVVTLRFARAGEVASTLRRVAPGLRIVPHHPTNSVIISGPPAVVEKLIDTIE
jgi:type II secretory pathway component GspD/PulD (secretin)